MSDGHGAPVRRTVTVPVRLPRYAEDIQGLWDSLCTGCHGRSGGLELAAGKSHPALVGVHAETKACASFMRVAPANPDGSALVMKLSGTACGNRMPRNNPTYFEAHPDELVRIRSWILGGAPKTDGRAGARRPGRPARVPAPSPGKPASSWIFRF